MGHASLSRAAARSAPGELRVPGDGPRGASHIALFLSSLSGGGVERSMLNLAEVFVARGHRVDLVVCHADGSLRAEIPEAVRLVPLRPASRARARLRLLGVDPKGLSVLLRPVLLPLKASTKIRYLPDLVRYLQREQPDALLSAMTYPNLVALWARKLAAVRTHVVVSERNTLSGYVSHHANKWRWRFLPAVVARMYPQADAIVSVAASVADDLAQTTGIDRTRIRTIYNPVVSPDLAEKAKSPVSHPWLSSSGPPVILGVGRLEPNKDFATLLRAFARVRRDRELRLLVLGEGRERGALESLARELGVAADVDLCGWVANPFAYMSRAALFVLSSAWEGLPGVLIQAMACGCPVVSTDCPGGSREILDGGTLAPLVPVGDDAALAETMRSMLNASVDRGRLRARAGLFSAERAADEYLEILLGERRAVTCSA